MTTDPTPPELIPADATSSELTCTGPTGPMMTPNELMPPKNYMIMVENRSSMVTDSQVQHVMDALHVQLERDWKPIWGTTAELQLHTPYAPMPDSAWLIILEDANDYYGALGYHEQDAKGRPVGKVFVGDSDSYGYTWSNTFSHELLEMMADPYVSLCVFEENWYGGGRLWSYEVCDACEHEAYSYMIGDVLVSDFVYPWWFNKRQSMTKYDHMGKIQKPFEILPGGYMTVYDVADGSRWQTVYAKPVMGSFRMHSPINNRKLRGVK